MPETFFTDILPFLTTSQCIVYRGSRKSRLQTSATGTPRDCAYPRLVCGVIRVDL
jgi:hypothetical protein